MFKYTVKLDNFEYFSQIFTDIIIKMYRVTYNSPFSNGIRVLTVGYV